MLDVNVGKIFENEEVKTILTEVGTAMKLNNEATGKAIQMMDDFSDLMREAYPSLKRMINIVETSSEAVIKCRDERNALRHKCEMLELKLRELEIMREIEMFEKGETTN